MPNVNRRQFILTSGVALGGWAAAAADGTHDDEAAGWAGASATVAAPEQILVESEQGSFFLDAATRWEWGAHGMTVQLPRSRRGMGVVVRAPRARLCAVTLIWSHRRRGPAWHLGDAWERAYGDLAWQRPDAGRVMPWYFLEQMGDLTHGYGVRTGCRAMASWRVDEDTRRLRLDLRCGGRGVRLGRRALLAAEVVERAGLRGESSFQAAQSFCRLMCERPLLPREPMVGMLDWYFTYGKCTDRLFVEQSEHLARLVDGCGVKAFALVDAGWAPGDRSGWHDDQTVSHPDFGSIEGLPEKVRALGLVPGLWTRVLCANPKDPEQVRLSRDRTLLDPSLPENLHRIRDLMRLFRRWGFGVVKHDYTTFDIFGRWGPEMGWTLTNDGWTFRDDTRTTAEIILHLYEAIRAGCGEAAIIGCNTVSHLSAGLVEYCRIGDDSGNNLQRAMKYGCNPFAFRLAQHNTFYAADPDCIGNLREIPWKYNRQFIRLVGASGALLQLSTRLEHLQEDQRAVIRAGMRDVGRPGPHVLEPLDWMERTMPARWRIGDAVVPMDWDLQPPPA